MREGARGGRDNCCATARPPRGDVRSISLFDGPLFCATGEYCRTARGRNQGLAKTALTAARYRCAKVLLAAAGSRFLRGSKSERLERLMAWQQAAVQREASLSPHCRHQIPAAREFNAMTERMPRRVPRGVVTEARWARRAV